MTLASKITVTRIALVPVFGILAFCYSLSAAGPYPVEPLRWWALAVFIAAAASDGIDGWVARRFNQKSELGAFLDPIADKSLLLTGVVILSLVDWGPNDWRLPAWFAAIVVTRDCIILGGIRLLHSKRLKVRIEPHWSGKICTVTQMFALGWVMLKVVSLPPTWPCIIASVFTLWSTVIYIRQGLRILGTAAGRTADQAAS